MPCFLRDIPEGARFLLCRTRKKYRLVRREPAGGRIRVVVQEETRDGESTLHPSCHVKPVIRLQLPVTP
jgi:hypothetical protein